jgi:uncharacterized membrane protein YfcA
MMMITIAKWLILLFASFIIFVGFMMLFAPKKARAILRKAGSTVFINYAEITLRLFPAVAMIVYADFAKFPIVFKAFGWFMIATSLVLYMVPRKTHHHFAMKSADRLSPIYIQLISPIAFLIGGLIIFNIM